jgi:hypothetical protein
MSSWPIAIKIVSHLQGLRGKVLFQSKFEHMIRDVQWKKSSYSEAPLNLISNASRIINFEDPYKEIWQKHWALRNLKSALDRLHRRSKIGTTLLFGTRFMRMMACWKDNLMEFNLEGCLCTYSVLEVKENLWKMRQRQGRDVSRWWRYEKGLNHGLMI